jgi:hypothetical protein
MKPGQWPVLDLTEADWPDIRQLFAEVFGSTLTPAMQAWKYGGGRGVGMGVRDGTGTLVAHYGGGYRPLASNGVVCTAIQMQDVMVSPTARDVLARFGPFGRLTRAFIQNRVGPQQGVPFGFGFPSARHLKLGNRLDMYRALETVWSFRWDTAHPVQTLAADVRLQPLDWGNPADLAALDALAQRHATLLEDMLMPVRDPAWWRHRYANHPQHVYAVRWLYLPDEAAPVAAMVVRQFEPGQDWELMDWLVATPVAHGMLLPVLLRWAAQDGVPGVALWASHATVAQWSVAALGAAHRSPACEMAVTHDVVLSHPVAHWAGRVWVTGGDTDFR